MIRVLEQFLESGVGRFGENVQEMSGYVLRKALRCEAWGKFFGKEAVVEEASKSFVR